MEIDTSQNQQNNNNNTSSSLQHSWIFHEIELSGSSSDSFSIKSWILTAMTLYPEDIDLKTRLFTYLIKNQPQLYRNEIDELFHELLTRSDNSAKNTDFWSPLETTLLNLDELAKNKDNELITDLAKYIWSLPSKKQHEILKNVIDRASQVPGNLQKVTRLALKLVEYDSSSFVDKLKDMMEKLLSNEKEIYSDKMNKYSTEYPGASQMISLINYANLYRKCYIFDVLLNYLEHLNNAQEKDSRSYSEKSIQSKHATRNFRKALEFGIGSQMFQTNENKNESYLNDYRL